MQGLSEALSEMKSPEAMWDTRTVRESINQHAPTNTIKPRHLSVPEWFKRKAKKIKKMMGIPHRIAKFTKNSFNHEH